MNLLLHGLFWCSLQASFCATNGDTLTTLNTTNLPVMTSLVISQDNYDNAPATTLSLQGPRQGHSVKRSTSLVRESMTLSLVTT